ncbi:hypothetical protein GO613_12780 [Azoarcus communis]|uniref:helix-turn-helix domain-containing protein n=1 Tax=Parazoarcus communis TaxID=41977 RepID=UPI0014592525|nr:helix-turn-helix domain-containing protein [Parazoarcus communis]NMG48976.1 hypothetical protein [Parazoarcus communis]
MQSTDKFRAQLDRLRTALAVREDQEVASMLGMTKAALSARKARGSFPEKELRALAQRRPDLSIDVEHVLSGTALREKRQNAAGQVLYQGTEIVHLMTGEPESSPHYPTDATALVENWQRCSALDQALVLQLVRRLAGRQ